ncbi:MAG: hypothetical protein KAR42_05225 [candidate division Zixibacteria bacterium]|nr:hypothetical protein [candidate division Zixibacteria bacterium]
MGFDFESFCYFDNQIEEIKKEFIGNVFQITDTSGKIINLNEIEKELILLKIPIYSYLLIGLNGTSQQISLYNIKNVQVIKSIEFPYSKLLLGLGLDVLAYGVLMLYALSQIDLEGMGH